jgi:hypothetical protein
MGFFLALKHAFFAPFLSPIFFFPSQQCPARVGLSPTTSLDVIPKRLWNDFKEPSMPDFDVRDFLHSFLKPSGSHILFSGDRLGLDSADVLKLTTENRLQLIICAKLINSTLNRFIIDGLSTIN